MFFSWERRQIKQNLKFSHFWENQFYHKAIAYDKIGGNYALSANSNFACTIHICNGNSSKSYDFHEKYKKIEKWIILVISVNFFWDFHWNSWAQYQKKSENMFFSWERRQIKQNLKFSNFWENQFYRKAIAYDKIGGNYALSANSTKICLLG